MRFTWLFFVFFSLSRFGIAGMLSTNSPYQLFNGFVAGEAENYHALDPAQSKTWSEITGSFINPRGGALMQVLPDNNSLVMNWAGGLRGPAIEYLINIDAPGTYRLDLRWDSLDGDSDSLFAGFKEIFDGAGGIPDWYEDTEHQSGNFNIETWDSLGGAEEAQPVASQNPMEWTITTPGQYTLRVVAREDGVALDTWVLRRNDLPAPSGDAVPSLVSDSVTMHHLNKVSLDVLKNDSGLYDADTLRVGTPPGAGTVTVASNRNLIYEHTLGAPASDTFTYVVDDISGLSSATTDVVITFSPDLRLPNTTVSMPLGPPPATYLVEEAYPGITFTSPTSMDHPANDTNRLFVVQRNGLFYFINNIHSGSPTKSLFMNISSQVDDDGNELGLKGFAFHPGYAANRYFYVAYCHWNGFQRRVRLSRFETFSGNPNAGDPNSELILIDQQNDQTVHNIDDVVFGPDNYLYVGFGDEGPQSDGSNNSQRIDKDIWSAVLRIDVDKIPGNLEPNPDPAIPLDAGMARFSIPTNNPFIGATQFNGVAVNPVDVHTEFYAVGFRNPWQFNFDPLTGEMWLGDVGNDLWEEVSVVTNGGNYGWAYFEGTHLGPKGIPPTGFEHNLPVWDYGHGTSEFLGFSITGGLVSRGANYPDLNGLYLCSDYVSGNIWTIERTASETNVVRIAGEGGLIQFGLEPVSEAIIMLDHGDGVVRKLVADTSDVIFPATLTETGFFADLADLAPNPGVLFYETNLKFWSDYADKYRWFTIPNLTDDMTYAKEGNWTFPAGMMWVKHFDLETTRGDSNTAKRIETRILVKTTNGSYGVSYKWNAAETEAYLVNDAGETFDIPVIENSVPRLQTWSIPSRAQCSICHTPNSGYALSFNTRQLNRTGQIAQQSGNFLALLEQAGYLSNTIDDPVHSLARHVRPDETEYSLEARARSYIDVNCSYCHRPGSGIPGIWDGRAQVSLEETGLINGIAGSNGDDPTNKLIVPGDVPHSIVHSRIAVTNGFTRMPLLGSNELDYENIQLISDWIGELAGRQDYDAWRMVQFGDLISPEGEPNADPDMDGARNYAEFLTYTSPTNEVEYWHADIDRDTNSNVILSYDVHHRRVIVEKSTNMNDWVFWDVPDNNGLPIAPGTVRDIPGPITEPLGYFRFKVEEL